MLRRAAACKAMGAQRCFPSGLRLPDHPSTARMNAPSEPRRLSDLTPQQRKSGFAAWLGWMFDGLDMHIYTLVASAFVAILVFSDDLSAGFSGFDRDNNGALTGAEWTSVDAGAFKTADHNADGSVS